MSLAWRGTNNNEKTLIIFGMIGYVHLISLGGAFNMPNSLTGNLTKRKDTVYVQFTITNAK